MSKPTEKDDIERFLAEADETELVDIIGQKLNASPDDETGYDKNVTYMALRVTELSDDEAREILRAFMTVHFDDSNLLSAYKDHIEALYSNNADEKDGESPEDFSLELRFQAALVKYWSPYIEVRSVTDAYDDPDTPCETIRAYFVGFIWMVIGSGVNQFFAFRFPSISLNNSVLQLLSWPSGKLLEFILPDWGFTIRGTRVTLNPGPWTNKEQMFATMFLSAGSSPPYITTANIPVQLLPMFYNEKWATFGYQVILTLSNQLIGIGLSGILRRFAVYPAKAMWPLYMPTIALNRALNNPKRHERVNGWKISQYWFFFASFAIMFVYFWFPNYIFIALSTFNWMTWIAPKNINLALITGSNNMGINPFPTFDWNVITGGGDPLVSPAYTIFNLYCGVWIGTLAIIGVYYNNVRWTSFLPMNAPGIFDNTGGSYNVSLILDSAGRFVEEKYQAYSPPFWTAASIVSYGAFFLVYTLGISYCLLQYRRDVVAAFRDLYRGLQFWKDAEYRNTQHDNTFVRSLNNYKDAPEWWFLVLLLIAFGLSVATVEHWPTNTPVWGIVFVLGLNFVFLIPTTMISSYTGQSWSLNVLVEIIIGAALKGRPQALNILKAYGVMIDIEAAGFASAWKTGLYTYVPSRAVFRSQVLASILTSFVSLGVLQYQLNLQGICTKAQRFTTKFTCPGLQQFFSASVLFGAIGTERFMEKLYPFLKWCFLIGAVLGPFFWFVQTGGPEMLAHWKPKYQRQCVVYQRYANCFNPVIVCTGLISFAPGNLTYFTTGVYIAAFWRYFVKARYPEWWGKYTYVLSAGFGCGIALSGIIMFFAVTYRTGTTVAPEIDWWGNNAPQTGYDGMEQPLSDMPAIGTFGPSPPYA